MNKIEKINVNGEDYELSVPVDDTLNLTSTNPVQNKIITETINKIKEENTGYKTITWTNESNMNNYKEEGIFIINGVHSNSGDNIPITAYAKGNIGGILSIAKSTSDSKAGEYIIGQHLVLANRVGGETKEYIRSCIVKNEIETWTPWKESGMIRLFGEKASGIATKTDIDSAIDNGQYAGVYMDADGFLPQGATFTLTVINNYAATAASSLPAENRQVTQIFIYTPLSTNGSVNKSVVCKRDGIGGNSITWSDLEGIGGSNFEPFYITSDLSNISDGITYEELKRDYFGGEDLPYDRPIFWKNPFKRQTQYNGTRIVNYVHNDIGGGHALYVDITNPSSFGLSKTWKIIKWYNTNDSETINVYTTDWNTIAVPTNERPTDNIYVGMQIFDTTLGKPIWYKGWQEDIWVDATGAEV